MDRLRLVVVALGLMILLGVQGCASETSAPAATCQVADSGVAPSAGNLAVDQKFHSVLGEQFGTNEKSRVTLGKGLLGTVADSERFVVVVDPEVADVDGLQDRLDEAATSQRQARVQPGCHSVSELTGVLRSLAAGEDGAERSSGWTVEPADSTVRVSFPETEATAAEQVRAQHGSLVSTELLDGESVLD